MAKRITIDRLAEIVAGGFQELQTEMRDGFRSVDARVDAHDKRSMLSMGSWVSTPTAWTELNENSTIPSNEPMTTVVDWSGWRKPGRTSCA